MLMVEAMVHKCNEIVCTQTLGGTMWTLIMIMQVWGDGDGRVVWCGACVLIVGDAGECYMMPLNLTACAGVR